VTQGRRAFGGVAALVFWLVVTAAWWMLALWPLSEQAPVWLERTRAVCFNITGTGLPDDSGWLLLVGQPIGVLAVLMVIWGPAVREGLGVVRAKRTGQAALVLTVVAAFVGLGAAGTRVVRASAGAVVALPDEPIPPDTYPRLDRSAPALSLVDQRGEAFELERLRGRPALLTFAFGHCETVCPLVVRNVLEARERQRASAEDEMESVPSVVVVTLDPWRDTPSRLTHIAQHWKLGEEDFVLSGDVDAVNGALDAWNVARQRDPKTGDVAHPPLVYVLDAAGRIAYATRGGVEAMVELVGRS
jgi:protein SCO1/2